MTIFGYRSLTGFIATVSFSALAVSGAAAQSRLDPLPTDNIRSYSAISNGTSATLGDTMKLSRTSARFSNLRGEIQLQYAGIWNKGADTDFGGNVYQVLNADDFFRHNKGKNGFCDEPVRWLTIMNIGTNPGDGMIRIGMLSNRDWRDYKSSSLGACSADTFELDKKQK